MSNKRTDTASIVIMADPEKIYQAFLDPTAVAAWRPPKGMVCEIYEFNPHEGGTYHMAFKFKDTYHAVRGKTSEHADEFKGCFVELVPNKRIVEVVTFESDDPAFAGDMTITTNLVPVHGGTKVTFICDNVPSGIKRNDHDRGMTSTLSNLAEYAEAE
jgi:uncharacterized protein YndB with AHSA1/START domain